MSGNGNRRVSRRGFLKISGSAAAAAAVGGRSRILHALVTGGNANERDMVVNVVAE